MLRKTFLLKRQLRKLALEIDRAREMGYDRQVRVQLIDDDLIELAAAINRSLDRQKQLKFEAEAAEQSLRRSVSDIAHDIRTPLAVIKGDLQLIERSGALTGELKDYLDTCLEKTETLKEMTDRFFELAVLESSTEPIRLRRIDLTSAMMEFILENEGRIRMAGIDPEISLPSKSVFISADPQMLGRMLGNLLGNALKYSDGDLKLAVTEDGCVRFANSVSGSIPDTERLFDRSYRADSSRSGGGAGLGLYIVRILAEKQNAEVAASLDGSTIEISVRFKVSE